MIAVWESLRDWWRERLRRAALPGLQLSCEFGGRGCSQITMGSAEPMQCRNCADGKPRYLSGFEVEQRGQRFESDVEDGWRKPDGQLCDRETYAEALAKRTTPAAILAERQKGIEQ